MNQARTDHATTLQNRGIPEVLIPDRALDCVAA